ncbi:MAG: EamA family transporter [Candidatus Faecousia sp.]|nr:DMT family transporter [Clostridiales bacterium]MDD5882461.1 EamA family transporter [Bacillota bacterium]MDY4598826.1 EamA family transporter [Candidatus Faecousia sp.]
MKKIAPFFVLSAGTLWGAMGVFVRKLGAYGFSPLQIACLRILFGALLFLLITGVFQRDLLKIRLRDMGLFLGMGLLSLLLFTVCYFTTIDLASLSVAAILLYTSPIWVMLMSAICFREKITRRKLLCAAMAFGGCVLVSGIGSSASLSPMVIVTGLLSAVGYGLYSIFGTFALRKYQPLTVTTYAFLFGAVGALLLCNPIQIVRVISQTRNPGALVLLIAVTALVTAVLPYLLYTVGLNHMRASAAAIMASIEPVVATAAGALAFGETLTLPAFAGIALVLGAIVVLNAKA